jgi:hypothetical protein
LTIGLIAVVTAANFTAEGRTKGTCTGLPLSPDERWGVDRTRLAPSFFGSLRRFHERKRLQPNRRDAADRQDQGPARTVNILNT